MQSNKAVTLEAEGSNKVVTPLVLMLHGHQRHRTLRSLQDEVVICTYSTSWSSIQSCWKQSKVNFHERLAASDGLLSIRVIYINLVMPHQNLSLRVVNWENPTCRKRIPRTFCNVCWSIWWKALLAWSKSFALKHWKFFMIWWRQEQKNFKSFAAHNHKRNLKCISVSILHVSCWCN